MHKISIDIETFSSYDISKCGVYKYAEASDFAVLLFAYSVDESPVQVVDLAQGEQIPMPILKALSDESIEKWAYNAQFERVCLSRLLSMPTGQYLSPKGWYCSMVWGLALGLPSGLAKIGEALRIDRQKLETGKTLIRLFCTLNKVKDKETKDISVRRVYPSEHPEKWTQFVEYNKRDVEAELDVQKRLSRYPLSSQLWQEFWIDQDINDRGVLVDVELAQAAVDMDKLISDRVMTKMRSLTGLENPGSTAQLRLWLSERGCNPESLDKKAVAQELKTAEGTIRQVLSLRQISAKSSVKKYQAILSAIGSDNRVRGLFQFYGANRTGRWAGRLVQAQNLPQNHIEPLSAIRTMVKRGDVESIIALYDDVPNTLSQLIRTAFIAKPGCHFVVADYAAIEARVIAWLAGEQWRQKVFAEGGDIYCASASQMFKVPVKKNGINGHLRQKGKIAELALGYGGSVGALKAMGALEMGLKEDELKSLVDMWRESNPNIVKLWWSVDRAVKKAICEKTTETVGRISFTKTTKDPFYITLPSGRRLYYVNARVLDDTISYKGVVGSGFVDVESYGPKFVENIIQATSRDLLSHAMSKFKGIVMHIHDELVIETDSLDLNEACQLMGQAPQWAEGLLTRADGYTTDFYKKD